MALHNSQTAMVKSILGATANVRFGMMTQYSASGTVGAHLFGTNCTDESLEHPGILHGIGELALQRQWVLS